MNIKNYIWAALLIIIGAANVSLEAASVARCPGPAVARRRGSFDGSGPALVLSRAPQLPAESPEDQAKRAALLGDFEALSDLTKQLARGIMETFNLNVEPVDRVALMIKALKEVDPFASRFEVAIGALKKHFSANRDGSDAFANRDGSDAFMKKVLKDSLFVGHQSQAKREREKSQAKREREILKRTQPATITFLKSKGIVLGARFTETTVKEAIERHFATKISASNSQTEMNALEAEKQAVLKEAEFVGLLEVPKAIKEMAAPLLSQGIKLAQEQGIPVPQELLVPDDSQPKDEEEVDESAEEEVEPTKSYIPDFVKNRPLLVGLGAATGLASVALLPLVYKYYQEKPENTTLYEYISEKVKESFWLKLALGGAVAVGVGSVAYKYWPKTAQAA